MLILSAAMAIAASAKDIKTLVITPQPRMNCENCENKIKNALRFERGVKDIATSIEQQTVAVTYDADKTSVSKLLEALAKAGYAPKEQQPDCGSCPADTTLCGGAMPCCGAGKSGQCCPNSSTEGEQ